jgi:hypothetical protein
LQRVLTTVTLLGLLVATAAAFAITEHLKLIKSPIYGVVISAGHSTGRRPLPAVFSPICNCKTNVARIRLRLRHPERVTVTIVDKDDHTVATVADNRLLGAHVPQHFAWDGRNDAGALVPDGIYRPWVQVGDHKFRFANKITLDTVHPKVLSATRLKPVLLAGPGRTVAIHFVLSEEAHPLLYLGNRPISLGRHKRPSGKIKWSGRLDHKPLRAGRYVLSVGAVDPAGNKTPASGRMRVPVDVRYVELTPNRITVRSGRPFKVHVTTAARRYTWRLGHRHGERRGRVLRLRAPSTPGTYRLVVAENGQATTAVVKVRAK